MSNQDLKWIAWIAVSCGIAAIAKSSGYFPAVAVILMTWVIVTSLRINWFDHD